MKKQTILKLLEHIEYMQRSLDRLHAGNATHTKNVLQHNLFEMKSTLNRSYAKTSAYKED